MHSYDFIIIGGGLVGTTLALALGNEALKIALVDDKNPNLEIDDNRLYGLTYGSCCLLKSINVWQELDQHITPIHEVHISQRGHFGRVILTHEMMQLETLGVTIKANVIHRILNEKLNSLPHVTLYRPFRLSHIKKNKDQVEMIIEGSKGRENLQAPILIGADGTHSTVRTLMNMPATFYHDNQYAIVTHIQLNRPHHYKAYERFITEGAIAMLPMDEDRCATILTQSKTQAEKVMQDDDETFLAYLQHSFGYRLGRIKTALPRSLYPIQRMKALQTFKHNVFLIGNAAHTLSPLAAQGLNLSLYEVAYLAESILKHSKAPSQFLPTELKKVDHALNQIRNYAIHFSNSLSSIFSYSSPPLKHIIQFGMMNFDRMHFLKYFLVNHLLGRNAPTSRLLLGKLYE